MGIIVELKVRSMADDTDGRSDSDPDGVWYVVIYMEEFDRKYTEFKYRVRLDLLYVDLAHVLEVVLTLHDDGARQRHGVYGWVSDLGNDVGDAADVIVVSMRYDHSSDLVLVFLEIGGIRNDVVNARHIFVRELKAEINDYDVITVLKKHGIAAYFFKAAKRYDAKGSLFSLQFTNQVAVRYLGSEWTRGVCAVGRRTWASLAEVASRSLL